MDNRFSFLDETQAHLIREVIARRDSELADRLRRMDSLSRADADAIMTKLSEEVTENLDADWEPTVYGREVSLAQARFNAARISEWPD